MKFIHTADWQIGKAFKRFGDKEAMLRQARLDAIETIGRLASAEGVSCVLVAGDVYDSETPLPQTLRAPLERMRLFPQVRWFLLPGNHDPHRPQGVWDRAFASGLPENVHPCLAFEPTPLGSDAVLLPAPLLKKTRYDDITAWMDNAPSPPGIARIGLAHGSVTGFSSQGEAGNQIDPARTKRAGLCYLALGDWHRTVKIADTVWYSGTPEPDRAGSQEVGTALVVETRGANTPPLVKEAEVGTYRWVDRTVTIADGDAVADIEAGLRTLHGQTRTILRLGLDGATSLSGRTTIVAMIHRLESLMFHVDADLEHLRMQPTSEDLEKIDFDGVLRNAAERLKAAAEDGTASEDNRRVARDALSELYLMATSGDAA